LEGASLNSRLLLCIACGFALTAAAWDGPEISKVTVTKEGDGARVRVAGKDLAQPRLSRHNQDKAWIASFDAYLRTKSEFVSLKTKKIRYVQYGWYQAKPPVVNLLAWIDPGLKPDVKQDTNGDWVIGFGVEALPSGAPKASELQAETGAIDEARSADVQGTPITPAARKGAEDRGAATPAGAGTQGPDAPKSAEKVTAAKAAPTAPARDAQGPTVSLDFTHTDVVQILKALALQTGTNIVTAPDVKGNLTVRLFGETMRSALELVTRLAGYEYIHQGNTYIVGPPEFLSHWEPSDTSPPDVPVKLVTRFYQVVAADPSQLITTVTSVVPAVTMKAGPEGAVSKLILLGPEEAVEQALQVLRELDVGSPPPPAPEIVRETYVARYADTRDLLKYFAPEAGLFPGVKAMLGPASIVGTETLGGTRLGATTGAAAAPGAPGSGGEAGGQPPRTMILAGPRQAVEEALGMLEQIDSPEPQVVIEVKVMDILHTDLDKLGIQWDIFDNGIINLQSIERVSTTESIIHQDDFSSRVLDTIGNNTVDKGTGWSSEDNWGKTFETLGDPIVQAFNLSLNPKSLIGSVNGFLDALVTTQRSKLLASPKVVTLDGRRAEVFIGDDVLYLESLQVTPTGTNIQVGKVLAGIQLNAVPRIGPDGVVSMALHPEVSLITAFNEVPGGGTLPQVARRYVDNVVRLRDGETLVIGGLIRQEELETMSRVPILGDLPILGQLFRHRSKQHRESEVVIFLTVRIVD
jgi:type II secretory pathway component GspD/PulD (secretin)